MPGEFKAKKLRSKRSKVAKPPKHPPRPAPPVRSPHSRKAAPSVPTGKPSEPDKPSDETGAQPTSNAPSGDRDPVVFHAYTPGSDGAYGAFTVNDNVPDCSGAESEGVVIRALNTYVDISTDHGQTFTRYDPSAIFTTPLGGGICCDQIVLYVRTIDRFVWFIQYRKSASGEGAFRLAVASPAGIAADPTAWTFWDWVAGDFGDATQDLDFPDMAATRTNLIVATDLWDPPPAGSTKAPAAGRLVIRFPLDQISKGAGLGGDYIKFTDTTSNSRTALKAHLAQGSTDATLFAGHVDNSTLRVYRWADSSGSSESHDVKVASWPKTLANLTAKGPPPASTDWLANLNGSIRFQVLGAARAGSRVLFAWTAASGKGTANSFNFPLPHVRIAEISTSTWKTTAEWQVWNSAYAFAYPALNINAKGEVGLGVAFGGTSDNPDSAFGIVGDYVVWYANGSDRTLNRWGDFITVRPGVRHQARFAGFGYYTMNSTQRPVGYIFNPFYVEFGRQSS